MSYTWKVAALDYAVSQDGLSNVVTTVHWRCSKEDENGNVGSSYGCHSLPAPDPNNFVAWDNVNVQMRYVLVGSFPVLLYNTNSVSFYSLFNSYSYLFGYSVNVRIEFLRNVKDVLEVCFWNNESVSFT